MSMLTPVTQENSCVSWAKNRTRAENGRMVSVQMEALEVHPDSQSIIKLIRNKKELSLTYKQLSIKIKEQYNLDLTPKFLWHFYTGYLNNAVVFKYIMDDAEKAMNLLDEFIKTHADLEMQRSRNKMNFTIEAEMKKSFPDSYKNSLAIIPLREQVLRLGSAIGYFPEMIFTPKGFALANPLPEDSTNPFVSEIVNSILTKQNR